MILQRVVVILITNSVMFTALKDLALVSRSRLPRLVPLICDPGQPADRLSRTRIYRVA